MSDITFKGCTFDISSMYPSIIKIKKTMRAKITVYFNFGIFDYPSEGTEYTIYDDEDPKEFLNKHLAHYLLCPWEAFQGAEVYKYEMDENGEQPIELIKYKINTIKYNLTGQMEFLLDKRIRYAGK